MSHSQTQIEPRMLGSVGHVGPVPSAEPPLPTPSSRRVLIIATIVALVAVGVGGRMWWRSHFFIETENAYVVGHVHPVSARIAGVVSTVLVDDNQTVRQGDVIAELDPADQRVKVEQIAAQINTSEQQVILANAQIAQVRAQASGAVARVAQSVAQLERAKQDALRYDRLYSTQMKAVSKAELDAMNALLAGAVAENMARRDDVIAAQAQIAAAESSREVTKAQINVLQIQLKDAQQQLAYNRIVAPVAGRIGKRSVEVGMRVQPGQQLGAIVEEGIWVIANFKETQLAGLHPGQAAKVTIDAMPDRPLIGRIESFSPASGAQFALLPADNATGNFTKIVQRVPIKIVLSLEDIKLLAGRLVPGMSALVEVEMNQPEPAKLAVR